MSDFIIETQIDKLIDLLSKRRKIPLTDAARELNISESQLEAWVSTLEDNGVVELKYPVLGQPEIILKGILPEGLKIIPEAKNPEEKLEFKEFGKETPKEVPRETPKQEEERLERFEKKMETTYVGKIEDEEREIKGLREKIGSLENEGKKIKYLEEKLSNLEKKMSESHKPIGEKEVKSVEEKLSNLEKKMSEVTEEIDISKLKEELFEVLVIISSLNDIEKIASYLTFIERIVLALKAKKAWDKVDKDLMVSTLRSMSVNWRETGKGNMSRVFEEMAKRIETI
jgi:DNA-binding Lrp family transcriptional regulator